MAPGKSLVTPDQPELPLFVEKEIEIDGVGMGVLSDGTPYLTQRGLARMCGVNQNAIFEMTVGWKENRPREAKIKEAAYARGYVKTPEDLYAYTYKVVSERFQYFSQDMSRSVGDTQLCLIVADHRGKKQDDLLRDRHHGLVDREGMNTSKYDNYVETIFLTPSHHSVGIQFADMVTGAIARRANVKDGKYFDMVKGTLRTSPAGKVEGYGLVWFPGR